MIETKRMAEFLGVEIGEEFEMSDYVYRFDDDGLYFNRHDNRNFIRSEISINSFMSLELKRLPWTPKIGDKYYFVDSGRTCGYDCYEYEEDETDLNITARTTVYRTEAEVVAEVKRLGWEVE